MKGASSKDGEAEKAGAAKKSKKAKAVKVKSKKAKANSAAKTDGAGRLLLSKVLVSPVLQLYLVTYCLFHWEIMLVRSDMSPLGRQLFLYCQPWRLLPEQVSNQSSYVLLWKLPLVAGFTMPLIVIGLSQMTPGCLEF